MRKHKEKKLKKETIMVLFVAFIMVGSIIGFIWGREGTQTFKYKELSFTRKGNQWSTVINNNEVLFDYFPAEVEEINLSPDIIMLLSNKPEIDTTSETGSTFSEEIALAQYNMALALNNLNIYVRRGFTTNNTFNRPVINCKDATPAVPVLYFKKSNQTRINLESNCIIAETENDKDILKIKDRVLYALFNII